jgi:hypothetical protein
MITLESLSKSQSLIQIQEPIRRYAFPETQNLPPALHIPCPGVGAPVSYIDKAIPGMRDYRGVYHHPLSPDRLLPFPFHPIPFHAFLSFTAS